MKTPIQIGSLTLGFSVLDLILGLVLPLFLLFFVSWLVLFLLRRAILKPMKIGEESKSRILRYFRLIVRVVVWAAAVYVGVRFIGASRVDVYLTHIWGVLTTPFLTEGNSRISIVTIALCIPIILIANSASKLAKRLLDSTVLARPTLSHTVRFTISGLVRYGVLFITILIGLSLIGVDLSSLSVLFGLLGIGLGFGLQNLVANYVAGLAIIVERPLKEGDRILVDSLEGDVTQIRLRSTVITTLTNETIIVPNSKLMNNSILNYSHQDRRIVAVNEVQVSYDTDLERASTVLLEVASKNPYALRDPAPEVRVAAFQDSGIQLALWTWIREATDRLRALSWTNREIWRAFKAAGIRIPFTQIDLYVKQ
jgi:potassium efflux system protein